MKIHYYILCILFQVTSAIAFPQRQHLKFDPIKFFGFEMCDNNAQPVIIAMTANTMQDDREICLQAGMDDYISIPVKIVDLVDILEKFALQVKA